MTDDFGPVRVFPAWFGQRGFAYLFSGAQGWSEADERAAHRLARRGRYVFGIDTAVYLAQQKRLAFKDCLYLPGALEYFAREQQRDARIGTYQEPELLGREEGATFVYMAQLQAPPLSFTAAVGIDPTPALTLQRAFCDHAIAPEEPSDTVPLRLLVSPHVERRILAAEPPKSLAQLVAIVALARRD